MAICRGLWCCVAITPCIVFAVCLVVTVPATASARVVHIVTGNNYPPFVDNKLAGGGWVTELVVSSLEDAGYEIGSLHWWPWKRGLEETRAGKTDGTFPWGYTAERATDLLYSEPLFYNTAHAWVRRDSVLSVDVLEGRRFCLPLGYVEHGRSLEIVRRAPNARISVPDMGQCFRMLAAHRVDFVISTPNDAAAGIANQELDATAFEPLEPPMHRIGYHFVVAHSRPNAADIISAVNAGIERTSQACQGSAGTSRATVSSCFARSSADRSPAAAPQLGSEGDRSE